MKNKFKQFARKVKKYNLPYPPHPFLFGIFPILFLFSNNIAELLPNVVIAPILISLILTSLLLVLLRAFLKDKYKTGLLSTLILILFTSYGHAQNAIGEFHYDLRVITIGPDKTFLAVWGIVLLIGTYFIVKTRRDLQKFSNLLNIIAVLLVIISLVNIFSYEIKTKRLTLLLGGRETNIETTSLNLKKTENSPDIYYLIFDRYAGMETLKDVYNYDIREFNKYLTDKGFYVASGSHANYPASFLSLASSLNMKYINYFSEELGEEATDRTRVYEIIQDFEVQRLLKSSGYKYIHVGSWWEPTRTNKNADKNFIYTSKNLAYLELDEFSTKLLETTVLPPILAKFLVENDKDEIYSRKDHRNRASYQFDRLFEIPSLADSPKFVFAHVILPHAPFVFNENCDSITELEVGEKGNLANYLNQLTCVNTKIEEIVDEIFKQSNRSAIIILQADEGPLPIVHKLKGNWSRSGKEPLEEKTSILNALYLPNKDKKSLYKSITPVNTFRLIFNLYFDTKYELMDDKIYVFENTGRPYNLYDVTSRLK